MKRSSIAKFWMVLLSIFLLNCQAWSLPPAVTTVEVEQPAVVAGSDVQADDLPPSQVIKETAEPLDALVDEPVQSPGAGFPADPAGVGEPAGCRSAEAQGELSTGAAMLAYADQLIRLERPLAERVLPGSWNEYFQTYLYDENHAISLDVDDVQNEYLLQRMLNALQVAGFVTWLRQSQRPEQNLHILALPLLDPRWSESEWSPYIRAYWQDPRALPPVEPFVLEAFKLPPCTWMVEQGFAPRVDGSWWAGRATGWPDYASAASPFLADSTSEANQVARQINWLGGDGLEAANTMCGPLSWSILQSAGVLPTGLGAWSAGSKTFWLAKPSTNGRPWSLFPPGTYQVYRFKEPLASFDFSAWPLYPGDFLYTYSEKDGFDHMLVVTEVHPNGEVYTVTNLVKVKPEKQVTIERALLANNHDPTLGLARNEWNDRSNGRTGHDGFEVFRWSWMVKDISGQPAAYTVLPGDTVGQIALDWRTSADWIARYNEITADTPLQVGQVLMIPPNQE
jgi:hypothetical protein